MGKWEKLKREEVKTESFKSKKLVADTTSDSRLIFKKIQIQLFTKFLQTLFTSPLLSFPLNTLILTLLPSYLHIVI